MKLEVNGVEYKNFTQASATLRLDSLSNVFSFSAVSTRKQPLPFKGGEPCRVIVDNTPVLSGFIEVVIPSYDASSHTITVQGRDKTGDLLDSNLDRISDIRSPVTLKAVIEKVVSSLGLDISVIDKAGSPVFNAAEDIAAPEPGDSAFDFLERLARHRQVLLSSDSDGNIVIERTPGEDSGALLQNVLDAEDNNILAATATYSTTGRYNIYKFVSSLNPVALNNAGNTKPGSIVNQNGSIVDTDIRRGRQLVLVSELSLSSDQDEARAKWEANIRKTRGLGAPICTVQGYRPEPGAALWTPNTLVKIVDDFLGINATMLINAVTYNFDAQGGSITEIELVQRNAYSLTLSEPRADDLGAGLI